MDVNSIARLSSSMAAERTGQEVGVTVLKKAMDISKSSATALIASVPMPEAPHLPAHLGKNVNTIA